MQTTQILDKIIDGVILVNIMQGRKDTMRIVPEMFYHQGTFLQKLWDSIISQPEVSIDTAQSLEEKQALGQAYYIPTALLFS